MISTNSQIEEKKYFNRLSTNLTGIIAEFCNMKEKMTLINMDKLIRGEIKKLGIFKVFIEKNKNKRLHYHQYDYLADSYFDSVYENLQGKFPASQIEELISEMITIYFKKMSE